MKGTWQGYLVGIDAFFGLDLFPPIGFLVGFDNLRASKKGTCLLRINTFFSFSLVMLLFGRFCKLIEPGLVGLLLFPLLDILLCLLHPLSIFFSEGFEGSWFVKFFVSLFFFEASLALDHLAWDTTVCGSIENTCNERLERNHHR